jgi:hypothetical protein
MRGRRRWLGALTAIVLAWWCWPSCEPDVEVTAAEPTVVEPVAEPPPLPVELPEPVVVDAGLEEIVDAGNVVVAPEPTPQDVEAYIAKWKKALEPLLSRSRRKPAFMISSADAGVAKTPCEPEREILIAERELPFDVLVAVDTSGSMGGPHLAQVARFLGTLEYEAVSRRRDARLLVLAATTTDLPVADAGVLNAMVSSNDGLEVLLGTARQGPGWLNALRPGVETRLILATDDGPEPTLKMEAVQPVLSELLADRPFSFNVIGGFTGTRVLEPSARPSPRTCFSRVQRVIGLDVGLLYQQLAISTGGLRASLCHDDSLVQLATRLATPLRTKRLCSANLDEGARVLDVAAVTPRGDSYPLYEERVAALCVGMRRTWLVEEKRLSLCPDTCAELATLGADRLRVRQRCLSE